MARTARALIRELAGRLNELIVFTSTANQAALTQITSTDLVRYVPNAVAQFNPWINGVTGTNAGVEARAASYAPSTYLLTLLAPGMSGLASSGDEFELHARSRRARKLEALNDAVGQLGLSWYREVYDTSITTAVNTWQYTLPAAQHWAKVTAVEIQISTQADLVGYPYTDARIYDWRADRAVDTSGVETWTLRFGTLPVPSRTLRVWGEAYFADLAADTDVLALSGKWERAAHAWIMDWAKYRLLDETIDAVPGSQTERIRARLLDKYGQQREELLSLLRPHTPGRINVPGSGQARYKSDGATDWQYLGALRSGGMS